MRYLTVVRHAKAERPVAGQDDVERALNERGRRQCEQLRAWAIDASELGQFGPATALVSSSARTRETFQRSFSDTALVSDQFFSDLIYNGHRDVSGEDLLSEIASIDPVTTSLLVVGHNPTVLELLWLVTRDLPALYRSSYPTGAAFVVALRDDEPVGRATYELVAHYVPA